MNAAAAATARWYYAYYHYYYSLTGGPGGHTFHTQYYNMLCSYLYGVYIICTRVYGIRRLARTAYIIHVYSRTYIIHVPQRQSIEAVIIIIILLDFAARKTSINHLAGFSKARKSIPFFTRGFHSPARIRRFDSALLQRRPIRRMHTQQDDFSPSRWLNIFQTLIIPKMSFVFFSRPAVFTCTYAQHAYLYCVWFPIRVSSLHWKTKIWTLVSRVRV